MVFGTVIRTVLGAVFGAVFGFFIGWLIQFFPGFNHALLSGLHTLTGIGGISMPVLLATIGFLAGIISGLLYCLRPRRHVIHYKHK